MWNSRSIWRAGVGGEALKVTGECLWPSAFICYLFTIHSDVTIAYLLYSRVLRTEDSVGIRIQSMLSCLEILEDKFKDFLIHFCRQQEASEGPCGNR